MKNSAQALVLALLGAVFWEGTALGQRPSDAPVPSCLDQSIRDQLGEQIRPRGVQKREFLKKGQLALSANGGLFAFDQVSSMYDYGGSLAFFFTEDLALELRFDVTEIVLDLDEPVAQFFGDDRFESGMGYLALANLIWSPIHAKLKAGDGIVTSDIMFVGGAGRLFHDSIQGISFDAGVILDLFVSRWISLRLDVRDVITVQEAVAETRLTNNILATGGIALWIPTWHGH